MITPRWWSPALLVSLACLAGPALSAPAQTINWQEAVARLAQEREQAVTCAGLLKKYGNRDAAALDRGSLAYGKAKAEYDGVIAGLSVALAQRERPASLGDLEERLGRGVAARAAFCKEAEALVPPAQTGQKGVVAEIVKGAVSGAVGPVIQALQAIYTRSRDEDAQARETIQAQLEAVSWPPFASVAPSS